MVTPALARALVVALLVIGCRPGATPTATADPGATATPAATPTPTPTPGATAIPTPTATATPVPAPSPIPAAVAPAPASPPLDPAATRALLRTVAVVEPAGRAPLAPDGETVVDPASTFDVELAAPVQSVRLVLLDAADAHVAATAVREVGATTRLELAPAAPLVPGSRYVLRVEGAGGRELRDAAGAPLAPLSFALLVAGTPPPPEPKRPARRRRR